MEEVASSDVRIVLSIKEVNISFNTVSSKLKKIASGRPEYYMLITLGNGFDQILIPTLVVATLNGHSLETEAIEPSANPQYDHDLVWEVEKGKLRKMRSGQVPLKLECFAIKGNDSKEKLGYLLLSLRSAQVLSRNTNDNVKANWHKLLGLKGDLKIHKPELLIALSIHDQEPTPLNAQLEEQTDIQSNKLCPILLNDERLIQLGPLNTCHELFLMNITAISAANVDFLLPAKCYTDMKNNLHFWCKILENDVCFNQSKGEYGDVWTLNEKIVIRIRSSLRVLKEYLQLKPFLFIYLRYKDDLIGQSEVNLQPLVPTANIDEFLRTTENNSCTLDQRCYLYKKDLTENDEMKCRNSYLDLQLKLQYIGSKTDGAVETPNTLISEQQNNSKQINFNEIDNHRNPAGDFGKHSNEAQAFNWMEFANGYHNLNKQSLSCEVIKNPTIPTVCSQSVDALLCQYTDNEYSKSVEAYHCYCLNISLIAIKSTSPKLTVANSEIRLHHPKTELVSTFYQKLPLSLGEKIKLHDIGCKLHFISATDEITHLLLSFPPKISIYKVEGSTTTCIAQSKVDVKKLFQHNKSECQCNVPLYDMEENTVGNLDILLNLEDHGPYYKVKRKTPSENLGPPILDDSLAYKIVDELETWKERQTEIFKVELKRKEDRHLNLLSQEWQRHRESLEAKLACSVDQCKMLAKSLNNATEDLRTRRLKSLEKETRLIKANEDLQWRYEVKMRDLRESHQTIQDGLTSKINALEKKNAAVETQAEQLSAENERLQLLVRKQSEELDVYQRGSLTQDQTASLLQEVKTLEEKLQNTQESKSLFKERWAKAVREIHRMKMEHQQAIQVQIKNSKEELQNLDLEEILCADSTALTNDKILLNEIQKEIDVIKPKPSFIDTHAYSQVFTPTTIDPKILHSSNRSTLKKSEECNERVQTLLEERDSLLKTSSYTIDDPVIMKLNAELRSLMMK